MLASFLTGRWSFVRRLHDRLVDATLTVDGAASWTPHPTATAGGGATSLNYVEAGVLHGALGDVATHQAHTWICSGSSADVFFSDGRAFHRVSFADAVAGSARAATKHDCGADVYVGQYEVEGLTQAAVDRGASTPLVRVEWRVQGPRKDYTSLTEYKRDVAQPGVARDCDDAVR